jgi:primosomal protein N' (replication factor Y)
VAVFPALDAPVPLPDVAVRLLVWPPVAPRIEQLLAMIEPEGSTIVLAPDPSETERIVAALRDVGRQVIVVRSEQPAAVRTRAWREARHGACVVVGGRVAALAPVPDLRGVVVLDDADESLAEERAPAWHARDLVAERARRVGARCTIVTPAPTVEASELAVGATVVAGGSATGRGWPPVRVVDLGDEPPGTGLLSTGLGPALQRALAPSGGHALCVLNRRGRAALLVCRGCDAIARCRPCGARLVEADATLRCGRCGTETAVQCAECGAGVFRRLRPGVTGLRDAIGGLVPRARVVAVDAASAPMPAFDVAVGTEAVLHRAAGTRIGLVAFLDFDQELLAPRFRAVEQSLWLLVRAARLVGDTPGGEVLVQTRLADHEVIRAAATGDVMAVLNGERGRRRDLGFPPYGGLAELSGDAAAVEAACAALRTRVDVTGPSDGRALARAPSSEDLCDALGATDLTRARALGRLRIDVDPLRV